MFQPCFSSSNDLTCINLLQQPLSVTVHPIVRLKPSMVKEDVSTPSFLFLARGTSRSSALLGSPGKPPSRTGGPQGSSQHGGATPKKTGFQDVLTLNPSTGALSLQRCNIHSAEHLPRADSAASRTGSTTSSSIERGLSRSLPASGVSMMMNFVSSPAEFGLRASEFLIASWRLRRERDWDEVRVALHALDHIQRLGAKAYMSKSE